MADNRPLAAEFKKLHALVRKTEYRQALRMAERLRRKHPKDLDAQYHYAVLLGDCQDGLSAGRIEMNRKASVRLLKPLMRRLSHFDRSTRLRVRNEYYWFSRQPRKQYLLGLESVRFERWKGNYSQGVGAAWYALSLAQRGRESAARRWALLSEKAWRRYLKHDRYYNAYVHLGLALGVLGRTAEMEGAFRIGAKIAGRTAQYHEFEEIRGLVSRLNESRKCVDE